MNPRPRAIVETRAYKKLTTALRREQRQPCWLCAQPIDYNAPPHHPDAFTADHIHPVSTHPELALIYGNLAPAHDACNKSRGNRKATANLGNTTNMW